MRRAAFRVSNVQYAALPWRATEDAVEILLVTTLKTRRWIVPKGWPLAGRTPGESASSEALEEAGVTGEVGPKALGSFLYNKHRKSGEVTPCKVHVYPMRVISQRRSWPDKRTRETCWCSPEEALGRVTDPGLRRLIAKFVNGLGHIKGRADCRPTDVPARSKAGSPATPQVTVSVVRKAVHRRATRNARF